MMWYFNWLANIYSSRQRLNLSWIGFFVERRGKSYCTVPLVSNSTCVIKVPYKKSLVVALSSFIWQYVAFVKCLTNSSKSQEKLKAIKVATWVLLQIFGAAFNNLLHIRDFLWNSSVDVRAFRILAKSVYLDCRQWNLHFHLHGRGCI